MKYFTARASVLFARNESRSLDPRILAQKKKKIDRLSPSDPAFTIDSILRGSSPKGESCVYSSARTPGAAKGVKTPGEGKE